MPNYQLANLKQQKELLAKARKGSKDAANKLAKSVMPWALICAAKQARNLLDQDDVLSAAGFAVEKAIRLWNPKRGALTTFVYFTTRSTVRDAVNAQCRYDRNQPPPPVNEPCPCELVRQETEQYVQNAVQSLPERLRAVIELRYYHNATYRLAAQQLDVSPEWARRLELIALQLLEEKLA